jgi:hypothetical protein
METPEEVPVEDPLADDDLDTDDDDLDVDEDEAADEDEALTAE